MWRSKFMIALGMALVTATFGTSRSSNVVFCSILTNAYAYIRARNWFLRKTVHAGRALYETSPLLWRRGRSSIRCRLSPNERDRHHAHWLESLVSFP